MGAGTHNTRAEEGLSPPAFPLRASARIIFSAELNFPAPPLISSIFIGIIKQIFAPNFRFFCLQSTRNVGGVAVILGGSSSRLVGSHGDEPWRGPTGECAQRTQQS